MMAEKKETSPTQLGYTRPSAAQYIYRLISGRVIFFNGLLFSILLAAIPVLLVSRPWREKKPKFQKTTHFIPFDLQGHRGARGKKPENTWPSMEYAILSGVTTLEVDLNFTADEQFILHHDYNLNRRICINEDGTPVKPSKIITLRVEDLKKLDCGLKQKQFPEQERIRDARLITLEEFFAAIRDFETRNPGRRKIGLNLEIKVPPRGYGTAGIRQLAVLFAEKLKLADMMKRSTVQSFSIPVLKELRQLEPEMRIIPIFTGNRRNRSPISIARKTAMMNSFLRISRDLAAEGMNVNAELVDDDFVNFFRLHRLRIIVWTLNTPPEMSRYMRMGVNGIVTDYPNRLSATWEIWKTARKLEQEILVEGELFKIPEEMVTGENLKTREARTLLISMIAGLMNKPEEKLFIGR